MDLWSISDQHAVSTYQNQTSEINEVSQETRKGKPRRLSERQILMLIREWLMKEYVASYCRSLASIRIFRRCYFIDALGFDKKQFQIPVNGLATPEISETVRKSRKSRSVSQPQAVPPALQPVAQLAQTLALDEHPITLFGLLLAGGRSDKSSGNKKDKRDEAAKSLPEAAQNQLSMTESRVLPVNWLEIAPLLLKECEQSPAIFLLNPLAPVLFTTQDLTILCQRTVPTELCLFLSHKQIEAHLLAASKNSTSAHALTNLLRSDRWKTLPITGKEKAEQGQCLTGFIELISAALQRFFQIPVQSISFPLISGPARVEAAPWTVLFATRRQDSFSCMNNAVYWQQIRAETISATGILAEKWFSEQRLQQYQDALDDLKREIVEQGRRQRPRHWPDLRQKLITNRFGKLAMSDYDKSIQQLIQAGVVRCAWRPNSNSVEEPERIPGNSDTLLW